MDSLDVARSCVRRWYVFVPILALSIVAGYQLAASRSPTYRADAVLTLYYPTQPTVVVAPNTQPPPDPRTRNPLYVTGGVNLLATSLVSDMNTPDVRTALRAERRNFTLTVALDNQNGNLIDITATGTNSQDVLSTAKSAVTLADTRLTVLQNRVEAPPDGQYHVFAVTPPSRVVEKLPSKVKYIGAVTALGLLVGGAAALLADGVSARRRKHANSRGDRNDRGTAGASLNDIGVLETSPQSRSSHPSRPRG